MVSPALVRCEILPRKVVIAISVVLAVFLWLIFHVPSPQFTILDAGAGQQISGGRQIGFGQFPFSIIASITGRWFFSPATWPTSSFRAGFSANSCCIAGYTAAHFLIFRLGESLTGRPLVALVVTAVALLQLPRFYKYYISLAPLLALILIYYYMDKTDDPA